MSCKGAFYYDNFSKRRRQGDGVNVKYLKNKMATKGHVGGIQVRLMQHTGGG
ncbi:hypothetical protein BN1184_AM_01670 [Pantoea ananatis]|nr:hypothetical protein BN1184_AM_01670 [Pantoea ananatis]